MDGVEGPLQRNQQRLKPRHLRARAARLKPCPSRTPRLQSLAVATRRCPSPCPAGCGVAAGFPPGSMPSSSCNNSRWRLFSLPGVCTRTSTNRSPLPRPFSTGTPLPRMRKRGARLGAFRNLQHVVAFESGNADFGAQRRLRKRDRNYAVQIVAFALEERMLLHVQHYVQVARRPAVKPPSRIRRSESGFHLPPRREFSRPPTSAAGPGPRLCTWGMDR